MTCEYLVTGGAGFIGSNICRRLHAEGVNVRILDNFTTGTRENLAGISDDLEIIEGDIRDEKTVQRALRGIRYVMHQAAIPSVPRSIAHPIPSHDVNTTGTLTLLHHAVSAGVERFVSASSSSVYGANATLPKHEQLTLQPLSPYALTKVIGEEYCRIFSSLHGITCVSLRYFNVFGPFQDPKSAYAAVIPAFIDACLEGRAPVIYGDGMQTRDFTYIDNVVQANLAACRHPDVTTTALNIGAGQRTSLLDLSRMIQTLTGSSVGHVFDQPRPGDVRDSHADISKAAAVIGYRPTVSLEEGLAKTIAWFRELRA